MEKDLKVFELQVQELINRRQIVINLLAIVVAGVIGLLFADKTLVVSGLFLLGAVYIVNLFISYTCLNFRIKKMLYKKGVKL